MPADSPVLPCNKWTWQGPEHIRTVGSTGLCSRLGRGAALSLLPLRATPPPIGPRLRPSVRGYWLGRLGLEPLCLSGSLSGSVLIWMQPNLSHRDFEESSKGSPVDPQPHTPAVVTFLPSRSGSCLRGSAVLEAAWSFVPAFSLRWWLHLARGLHLNGPQASRTHTQGSLDSEQRWVALGRLSPRSALLGPISHRKPFLNHSLSFCL